MEHTTSRVSQILDTPTLVLHLKTQVAEAAQNPAAEIAWYFTNSRSGGREQSYW